MQKDSDGTFNVMLIWTYVQVKQFENAFIQAKALDKRFDLYGTELIDLGKICFENKSYQTSINIYTYVVEKYPKSENYAIARQSLIETREEIIKNIYPVQTSQIRVLISDYSDLIKELGLKRTTAEAMRKMAMLYAFYLDENDSAILILNRAIAVPRTNHNFVGNCKLNLGDIYLLKNEPWESILLYSQVDKTYKEQTIGQEAKLSLAKLYFYQGDFQLAQENLDILKLATTREIANDAMDLSLLIQDNLDTSDLALSMFANIELLKFQQKLDSAELMYNRMLTEFPNHSLCDEIYWNLAFVHLKMGDASRAVKDLDEILIKHKNDIYGDDALFMKADLFEKQLNKKEEAMELYKQILFDFPGSIYNAEARKRFRELRGDYQ
jgi:tetratricopeptide (TPR) repeat protein